MGHPVIEWYEAYVNSLPVWYRTPTVFVLVACLYTIAWGWTDGGLFGSTFYRRRMIRGAFGVVLCAVVLWPLVVTTWLLGVVTHWNMSELDEALAYERRKAER